MSEEQSMASKGGEARAKALSPEERSAIASEAAKVRWKSQARELRIPLSSGAVASIPFPMTRDDFDLLSQTLELWESALVNRKPLDQAARVLDGEEG